MCINNVIEKSWYGLELIVFIFVFVKKLFVIGICLGYWIVLEFGKGFESLELKF